MYHSIQPGESPYIPQIDLVRTGNKSQRRVGTTAKPAHNNNQSNLRTTDRHCTAGVLCHPNVAIIFYIQNIVGCHWLFLGKKLQSAYSSDLASKQRTLTKNP